MFNHRRLTLALFALCASSGCSANAPPEWTGSSQSASTVCGMTSIEGMDVSHYDGTIDWASAKGSGIDFAFVKATEGTTFVDPMFATNWAGMKAAGVVRGAYHFFHSNMDPVAQADFVTKTVGALETGDLPIVIDLEVTDGNSEATVISTATTFLTTVTSLSGKTAMIYVSPSFLSDYSSFSGNPLWIANWAVMCPDVPAPWSTWTFWQYSDTGTVSGVSGASSVDLDHFNGTMTELQALGGGSITDAGTGKEAASTADSGAPSGDASTLPPMEDGGRDARTAGGDAGNMDKSADGGSGGGGGSGSGGFGSGSPGGGCSIGADRGSGGGLICAFFLLPLLAVRRRNRRDENAVVSTT
jgi:lysozyme